MATNQNPAAVPAVEKKQPAGLCVYEANGEEVKLTFDLVKKCLVNGDVNKVTEGDMIEFINMCKFNKLNPFLGEAYLIKYGNDATMIVSKEAFFKRADACPDYEGFDAGVITIDNNGNLCERIGSFYAPNETLVGGWATVYRKGRRPTTAKVRFAEYSSGKSNWASKPATMIVKVAKVQALREAFPAQLSNGMYTEDEVKREPEDAVAVEINENANVEYIEMPAPAPAEVKPAKPAKPAAPAEVEAPF